jgi:hypothetical protein
MVINNPSGYMKTVFPGQTSILDSTSRTLAYDATSEFDISIPKTGSTNTRMRWTGVGLAPLFRIGRLILGGADTVLDFTRAGPTALTISYSSGTAVDFSTAQIGDEVYFQPSDDTFTSPFSYSVQGQALKVIDKTLTTITVRDNGLAASTTGIVWGANFADAMRVFSGDGVQIGDRISFASSANLKVDNKLYTHTISAVTDRDIIFSNPYAIPETSVPGANSFSIFSRILSFIAISASGPISLKLDNSTEYIKLFEFEPGCAMFMGTIQANSVSAINDTDTAISVVVHTGSF